MKKTKTKNKQVDFRIIELPTHQVLLTKDFDEEEGVDALLTITFFTEDGKVVQGLGYSDEATRDRMFDKLTDEQVQEILSSILKMLKD